MRRGVIHLLGICVTGALLGACGYALVGTSSNLPEDIKSIYISQFANETTRSQVDIILTQEVASEFLTRRQFTMVSSRSEADAEMTGAVTNFHVRPVSFDTDGRAREYEIVISANVMLSRVDEEEEILWQRNGYQFRENYELEDSAQDFFDQEDIAILEVADKFAETLVIDVLEGF